MKDRLTVRYAIIGLYETNEQFREELAPERYRSIIAAKNAYTLAAGLEEKVTLVLDNYGEFDAELLRLADEAKKLLAPETDLISRMRARVLTNRRIVNLLTACRLYLDQSSHTISALFGDKSDEFKAAKQRESAAYDSNLSYRFMDELRNQVQHRSFPVQCLSFTHHQEMGNLQFTVNPMLELSQLKEDSKFKRSILDEIQAASRRGFHAGEVGLRGRIKEYVSAIWSLHLANAEAIANGCADRFSLYRSVVEQYQRHNGKRIVFPRAVELDGLGRQITETFLVENISQYYDDLRKEEPVVVKRLAI